MVTLFYIANTAIDSITLKNWLQHESIEHLFFISHVNPREEIAQYLVSESKITYESAEKHLAQQILRLCQQRTAKSEILFVEDGMLIDDNSIMNLSQALHAAERHGVALPRHDGSSFLSVSRNGESVSNEYYKKFSELMPFYHLVPYNDTSCVMIKRDVFDLLWPRIASQSTSSSLYYVLQNFCLYACDCGYSAISCNRAFLRICGWNIPYDQLEQDNITGQFSYIPYLHERYLFSGIPAVDYFSESLCGINTTPKILFDLDVLPPFYNGTSEYSLSILWTFLKLYGDKYDITVLVSEEADAFHRISEQGVKVIGKTSSQIFDLAIVPYNLYRLNGQLFLNKHALRVVYCMLDVIALRCNYLNAVHTDFEMNLRLSFKLCDGILCISEYTRQDAMKYFLDDKDLSGIPMKAIWPGVRSLPDIAKPADMPFDRFILVMGNSYKHKLLSETVESLSKSEYNFIVVGLGNGEFIHPNIFGYDSGWLSNENMAYFFKKCDMLVFPSCYEGFGLPIVSAIQEKKPVVLHDNGMNREITEALNEREECCSFYREFDELPMIIENALKNSIDQVQTLWSWEDCAAELDHFFYELLNKDVDIVKLNERWRLFNFLESMQPEQQIIERMVAHGFRELIKNSLRIRLPRLYKILKAVYQKLK
ncbi:MAG: glycosyltransferase [Clostridiales bacterium]|nr:glycosyltransferase [Clostridiales bacterium]